MICGIIDGIIGVLYILPLNTTIPYLYMQATDIKYAVLTNCDLQIVGEEFSSKPYALAVQQGSPLKDLLTDG